MGASRFPGKPLERLGDRPVVQWVYDSAKSSGAFDHVVIATDSEEIAATATSFGAQVEMTSAAHHTGSDRVAEVAVRNPDVDVFVNAQGDQPFITEAMWRDLVAPYLAGEMAPMSTLGCPLADDAVVDDPNTVKVVCDLGSYALYFSRSPIPYRRGADCPQLLHHVGVYAFTREFLVQYAGLGPTPLEQCEGLEQLRVLEHGHRVRVCVTASPAPIEINTPDDLARAEAALDRGAR
jgi:3-deoxy-manno-octulosonate cytidylyltransferase (CMP-KDO synthetase)